MLLILATNLSALLAIVLSNTARLMFSGHADYQVFALSKHLQQRGN